MNRLRTILVLAGVLLVAAAIAGVAQPRLGRSATSSSGSTITVTGNGAVDAMPDRASFDFGVTSNGSTAADALSRNASEARAIIDALKKAGVPSSEIQTTQVSLWPQTSNNGRRITGYQASNSVQVTAPLGRWGQLVDAAVGAGANTSAARASTRPTNPPSTTRRWRRRSARRRGRPRRSRARPASRSARR